MKRPSFQFYPADWRKDVALRACSVAARGLWIDLMCIAHECEPYGYLMLSGRPLTTEQIAAQVGMVPAQCKRLLVELLANGVARKDEDGGAIYSARMVRDERIRNLRAESGKLGGNPALVGRKVKQTDNHDANQGAKQEPTPSSSSSSSSSASANTSVPSGTGGEPPTDRDLVFANGVPLLAAAGVKESSARSFLATQCKEHGEVAVRQALNRCAAERPGAPVPWLIAVLGSATGSKPRKSDALMAANIAAGKRFLEEERQ